jgi:two-component system response regulator DesR
LHTGVVPLALAADLLTCRDWSVDNAVAPTSTSRGAPVIRVLVAEHVDDLRDTLVALLELEDDLEVVAEPASGDRIVPAALLRRPDVALIDIDLPGADGLTVADLHRRLPACRTLIFIGLTGWREVHLALAAGASGLLSWDDPADVIIDAIRRAASGEPFIDSSRSRPERQ